MKICILIFIMASVSFKLNAFDTNAPEVVSAKEIISKARDFEEGEIKDKRNWELLHSEDIKEVRPCPYCPEHLKLTAQINGVVQKMASDPANAGAVNLPVKVNRLKFLFYTLAIRDNENRINCYRFRDEAPILSPTRFDGQLELLASDVLTLDELTDAQLIDPKKEEVIYYYRGEGAEKNILVQAIFNKEGGHFRYYKFTPSKDENNPYSLPEMTGVTKLSDDTASPRDQRPQSPEPIPEEENFAKFEARVEMKGKYIPKNLHLLETKLKRKITEALSVKGSTDMSIKGNQTQLSFKKHGDDVVSLEAMTKYSGKTSGHIILPFSVHLMDYFPSFVGSVKEGTAERAVTVSVVGGEYNTQLLRTEYRKNRVTGQEYFVIAKDIYSDDNDKIELEVGKDDSSKKYGSLKHVRPLTDTLSLVLSVRLDEDKNASVYYQVERRF